MDCTKDSTNNFAMNMIFAVTNERKWSLGKATYRRRFGLLLGIVLGILRASSTLADGNENLRAKYVEAAQLRMLGSCAGHTWDELRIQLLGSAFVSSIGNGNAQPIISSDVRACLEQLRKAAEILEAIMKENPTSDVAYDIAKEGVEPTTKQIDELFREIERIESSATTRNGVSQRRRTIEDAKATSPPEADVRAVRAHFERCWRSALLIGFDQDLKVDIKITLSPTGSVSSAEILDSEKYLSDKTFQSFSDQARRSVMNCGSIPVGRDHLAQFDGLRITLRSAE